MSPGEAMSSNESREGNLAQHLAAELVRVAVVREQYRQLDGRPNVNVRPTLLALDRALAVGIAAAGVDDAVTQLSALRALQNLKE